MIKVIKHGYKKYHTTCLNCQCHFSYEIEDVKSKGEVQCPDCKRNCYHNSAHNAMLTSKFEDEITE